jgi:hypothetical protein
VCYVSIELYGKFGCIFLISEEFFGPEIPQDFASKLLPNPQKPNHLNNQLNFDQFVPFNLTFKHMKN